MTTAIRHRGPDDAGLLVDGPAALGHRRLSIVDVAGGHQPMANETGDTWIVYNGEVFNHTPIRAELEALGHRYANRSDTETLLHGFEQWGPASVERYRGMFAYAIWDSKRQKLFAVRDRLGIKPFYYYFDRHTFAFGSEIKALLEHPAVPRQFDPHTLDEYLAFGYLSGERTMFRGIHRLPPGHYLTLAREGDVWKLEVEPYWDVPERPAEPVSEADCVAEVRRRLEETVEMRLMSDVPLGAFLSGGADSSAITALMQRSMGRKVKTFSVGYDEQRYSELSYAAEVAEHLGTDHREVRVSSEQFFGALPRLIWHEDEPITWPSSVSLHFVSKLAAETVKVVLTGEGADEMFAGYERYAWNQRNTRAAAWWGVLPQVLRDGVRHGIHSSRLLSGAWRRRLGHTFLGCEPTVEALFLDNFYAAFPAAERRAMLGEREGTACETYLRYWNARPGASLLSRMLYADQKTYLVELLMKQDQMSMSTSIESRVPFLDHTFVEFSAGVPDHLRIHGRAQKYVLKKAVEGLIPDRILHRPKMGFPTPLREWLRRPEAARWIDPLIDGSGFAAGYLDLTSVRDAVARHRQGQLDATDRIWRLMNLDLWGRVMFDSAAREELLAPVTKA